MHVSYAYFLSIAVLQVRAVSAETSQALVFESEILDTSVESGKPDREAGRDLMNIRG